MLASGNLAWRSIDDHHYCGADYAMHPSLGLSLMGILASVRAGTTRERITHRPDAHRAYVHYVAAIGEGSPDSDDVEQTLPRLETLYVPGIDLRAAKLKKLLELREREDAFVRKLRRNFQDALAKFREDIGKARPDEREEVLRNTNDALKEDLEHLQQSLEIERTASVIGGVTAALNLKFGDALESLAGGMDVVKEMPAFRIRRQEILEGHPTSWLYVANERAG